MNYKIKRKKRTIKVSYICLILLVIIVLMSTSYSLWQKNLYIQGTVDINYLEPELAVEVVKPDSNSDRLSTNTSFVSVGVLYRVFEVLGDEYENNNTVVTKLENANKVLWIGSFNKDVTFTFTIQNISGFIFTDGNVMVEEYDPDGRINPTNATLSTTTVNNGDSVTLTAEVTFDAKNDITVGSYVNYKISFLCDGARRYYNYKILISG